MSKLSIKDEAPPNIKHTSDRVVLMLDRFKSIKNNYAGMLYFCQRITGNDDVSMSQLESFEIARFRNHKNYIKNHSFPVSSYLKKIDELEKKIYELEKQLELYIEKY